MGDRANVVMIDKAYGTGETLETFFYTHWRGSELPYLVQTALRRKQRWNDPAYLGRIVFCTMLDDDDVRGETGFGISGQIGDNSYPLIVVDALMQVVRFEDPDTRLCLLSYSFEEYCALPDPQYPKSS